MGRKQNIVETDLANAGTPQNTHGDRFARYAGIPERHEQCAKIGEVTARSPSREHNGIVGNGCAGDEGFFAGKPDDWSIKRSGRPHSEEVRSGGFSIGYCDCSQHLSGCSSLDQTIAPVRVRKTRHHREEHPGMERDAEGQAPMPCQGELLDKRRERRYVYGPDRRLLRVAASRKQVGEEALAPERGYKIATRLVCTLERGHQPSRQHVIEARPERHPINATRSATWRGMLVDAVR